MKNDDIEWVYIKELSNPSEFQAVNTLDVGQCFDWFLIDDKEKLISNDDFLLYEGEVSGILWKLKSFKNDVYVHQCGQLKQNPVFAKDWWLRYTQYSNNNPSLTSLQTQWASLARKFSNQDTYSIWYHLFLNKGDRRATGCRVLKQDFFNCLIAYIASTNNNIKRIKRMYNDFKKRFGYEKVGEDGITKFFTLPPISKVLDTIKTKNINVESILKEDGWGYRAKYVHKLLTDPLHTKTLINIANLHEQYFAEQLAETNKTKNIQKIEHLLLSLPGIGQKVADCIILYTGLDNSVVPLDVNMIKAGDKLFYKEETIINPIIASPGVNSTIPTKSENSFKKSSKKPKKKSNLSILKDQFTYNFGPFAGWAQLAIFQNEVSKKKAINKS